MNTLSYRTEYVKPTAVTKNWVVVDATGMVLGRLASQVAMMLRGKHKPYYTPNVDCGDHVIVINADKVRLTGRKISEKDYFWYSGYPGGKRSLTAAELMARHPEKLVERAVKNMLPKNKIGAEVYRNLHVYAGPEHKHAGNQPQTITLKYN